MRGRGDYAGVPTLVHANSDIWHMMVAQEKRFGRFARGLLFTGRPLFLCRGNRKVLHCQPVLYSTPTVVAQYLPLALVVQQMARPVG